MSRSLNTAAAAAISHQPVSAAIGHRLPSGSHSSHQTLPAISYGTLWVAISPSGHQVTVCLFVYAVGWVVTHAYWEIWTFNSQEWNRGRGVARCSGLAASVSMVRPNFQSGQWLSLWLRYRRVGLAPRGEWVLSSARSGLRYSFMTTRSHTQNPWSIWKVSGV